MYKFTKKDIDSLKNDPLFQMLTKLIGVDANTTLENIEKSLIEDTSKDDDSKKKYESPEVNETDDLDEYIKAGIIEKCPDEEGWYRFTSNSTNEVSSPYVENLLEDNNVDEGEASEEPCGCEKSNITTKFTEDELETFVEDYRQIDSSFRKLQYVYGINFNSPGKGESLYSRINSLIWFLASLAFGEDNAELICDYIFGNTEFDSVHALFKELN